MTATYTAASSATPRRCPHPTTPPISFLDKGISMRRRPPNPRFNLSCAAPSLTSATESETQISGSPQRMKHPSTPAHSASPLHASGPNQIMLEFEEEHAHGGRW